MPQLAEQDPSDVMQDLDAYELTVVLPVDPANQTPSLPPYVVKPCVLAAYHDKIAGETDPQTKLFDFGNGNTASCVGQTSKLTKLSQRTELARSPLPSNVRPKHARPRSRLRVWQRKCRILQSNHRLILGRSVHLYVFFSIVASSSSIV